MLSLDVAGPFRPGHAHEKYCLLAALTFEVKDSKKDTEDEEFETEGVEGEAKEVGEDDVFAEGKVATHA